MVEKAWIINNALKTSQLKLEIKMAVRNTSNRVLAEQETLVGESLEHCCKIMENVISENRIYLKYDNSIRWYHIMDEYNPSAVSILHCPWCTYKLPLPLSEERQNILEQEYGLRDTWKGGKDYNQIPAEFHTDEWWKNRGL